MKMKRGRFMCCAEADEADVEQRDENMVEARLSSKLNKSCSLKLNLDLFLIKRTKIKMF